MYSAGIASYNEILLLSHLWWLLWQLFYMPYFSLTCRICMVAKEFIPPFNSSDFLKIVTVRLIINSPVKGLSGLIWFECNIILLCITNRFGYWCHFSEIFTRDMHYTIFPLAWKLITMLYKYSVGSKKHPHYPQSNGQAGCHYNSCSNQNFVLTNFCLDLNLFRAVFSLPGFSLSLLYIDLCLLQLWLETFFMFGDMSTSPTAALEVDCECFLSSCHQLDACSANLLYPCHAQYLENHVLHVVVFNLWSTGQHTS